ncbi:MAG: ATP-binding protein [Dethiobacteraceae bacterium]
MYFPHRRSLVWRYLWILSFLTVIILTLNFFWSSAKLRRSEFSHLRNKASALTEQFIAMRSFIADNHHRINFTASGKFDFKHLTPADVGKGASDLFASRTAYLIKQTRLNARNPENLPDAFEREALSKFAQNPELTELYTEYRMNDKQIFRYITPIYLEQSCLACHGEPAGELDVAGFPREGLRGGELAGAISVLIPMGETQLTLADSRNSLLIFSLVLLVTILLGSLVLTARLVIRPLQELANMALQVGKGDLSAKFGKINAYGEVAALVHEFSVMVNTLKDLYQNMERKVKSRTREMEAANLRLQEGQKYLTQLNYKLSENSRLKSEFMATVTHELKTPLTSIVAFCEILLDEIPGPLNGEQKEDLLDIKTSAQQLMILISDILDMAKFEAGALRVEKEKVDLNDVFRVVRRTMSAIAYQNNIRLTVSKSELPLLMGDPERLRQIISNLISNSIKFVKEGGEITVFAEANKEFAAISVADTGEGIPPELMPHIFEKFRQGEESLRRRRGGTGLGLALVKTLVELHDGSVSVKSELGKGTTFTIRIPFVRL